MSPDTELDLDLDLRRRIAATLLPGFTGTMLPGWLAARLRDGLAGVCIFGPNIVSRSQLRELTDAVYAANPLAIVAIDEEGGDVTRLYYDSGSPYPGNAVLGRLDDLELTEHVGRQVGWELRRAGCNLALAPDVDVNSNPDNPVIGVRSFGGSAERVAAHGAAWIRGLQAVGVAASAKHFPGHGDTAQDSHLALPVVDRYLDVLRERELVPFEAAIAAGTRTVMTSHILLPQLDSERPATFSPVILGGLLRAELGFGGVVVSDALDMHGASGVLGIPGAAVAALAGGCDLLCIGTDNTGEQLDELTERMLAAVRAGELGASRVEDAAGRVLAFARDLEAERRVLPLPEGEGVEPGFDLDVLISAFDVRQDAAAWRQRARTGFRVVRLEPVANIAVGVAPWGPFAAARVGGPLASEFAARPALTVSEEALPVAATDSADGPVLVVGKDNHRHAFARAAIDGLRAGGADVLVVDMGWPSDDRRYADIATFGASRVMGEALLRYLDGSTR